MNTAKLREKLNTYKAPKTTLTIDEVFSNGDFEDTEPGDAFVYYCGEDGHGYHKYYVNWKAETKDGKQYLECMQGDEDGNWELDLAWESGEDPSDILERLQNETNEYFLGWAKYDLDCAESGIDMLELPKRHKINRRNALKSAKENISFLLGRPK